MSDSKKDSTVGSNSSPSDGVNQERVFLHDIATPIAVALGMIDLIVEDAESGVGKLDASQAKRLEKSQTALLKLQEMLVARRQVLVSKDKA